MTQATQPAWPMYRALVGIGMLCGLLIASAFQATKPVIERNRAEALERAVFNVLPNASRRVTFVLTDGGSFRPADDDDTGERVHAGFDRGGQFVGVAIEARGMGYADTITVLYGYDPNSQTIVGYEVLTSKETPGLGTKIETEPAFLENFTALDVSLDATGKELVNKIVTVKQGEKTNPWQIDGITGATISSKAIGNILASSTTRWIPLIAARFEDFRDEGADDAA